jgi:hypothetical protein
MRFRACHLDRLYGEGGGDEGPEAALLVLA